MMAGKCIRLSKKILALVLALLVVTVIYNKGIAKRANWRYSNKVVAKSVYISKGRGIADRTDDSNGSSKDSSEVGGSTISLTSQEDTILEHWVPDWYNNSDSAENMEAMLIKRRTDINTRCDNLVGYTPPNRAGVYKGEFLESNTLRYCATYKAGYTFWKVFIIHQQKHDTTVTGKMPAKKVIFMVTRNPWHRLVSCWHDRFTLKEPLRSGFMSRFCNGKTWPELPPFSEFIQHCVVALWKLHKPPNFHWMPAMDRCHVCGTGKLQYDYILSQENMDEEGTHMLTQHAGFGEDVKDTLKELHSKILRPGEGTFSNNYQDYYKNISEEHMEILKEIYKHEIVLFDYPKSPFVDFTKS